jgi:hypothetical protein
MLKYACNSLKQLTYLFELILNIVSLLDTAN